MTSLGPALHVYYEPGRLRLFEKIQTLDDRGGGLGLCQKNVTFVF